MSPNYRVSMMHHNPSAQGQQQQPRHMGGFVQSRAAGFDRGPSAPHGRKGFHNMNVEMTEELFKAFHDKLKMEGKTAKDVLTDMIIAYTGNGGDADPGPESDPDADDVA